MRSREACFGPPGATYDSGSCVGVKALDADPGMKGVGGCCWTLRGIGLADSILTTHALRERGLLQGRLFDLDSLSHGEAWRRGALGPERFVDGRVQ